MKTKRIVAWLLTFLMVLGVMPARVVMADSALVDAETKLEFTIEADKATITGYSGNKDELKELVVPEVVKTEGGSSYDVSAIAAGAFSYDQYPNLDSIAVLGSDVVIGEKMCGFKADGTRNGRLILWVTPGSTLETYAKSQLFKPNNLATAISDITDTRGEKDYIYTETSGFEVNAELTVGTIYGETKEQLDIADIKWTSEHPNAVSVVPKAYVYNAETGKVKASATVIVNSVEGIEDTRECVIKATTKSGLEKSVTITNIMKSATAINCECVIYKETENKDSEGRVESYTYTPVDKSLLSTDSEGNLTFYKDDTLTVDEGYIVSFRPYVTGSAVGEGAEEDFVQGCYVPSGNTAYEQVYNFGGYGSSGEKIWGSPLHLDENKDDYVFRMKEATGQKTSITFNSFSCVLSKKINIDIKSEATQIMISLEGSSIESGTTVIAGYKGQLSYTLNANGKTSTDTAVWSSNDINKASVSSTGVLEANQDGLVKIICKVEDTIGFKRTLSKTISLNVIKKIEYQKIGLSTSSDGQAVSAIDVENGKSVTVYPVEAEERTDGMTPNEYLTYVSSDSNVATVDEKGVITGKNVGSTTITVKTNGRDMSASITVNVFAPITEIKLAEEAGSIPAGQTKTIKYSVNTGATDKVIWQSLDKSIATVTDNGEGEIVISALGIGQTNVEGYAKNNEQVKKNTQVTVIPAIHMETMGIKVSDGTSYVDKYVSEDEDTKGITIYEVEIGKSIVFEPEYFPANANDGIKWTREIRENNQEYATGTIVGTQLTVKAATVGGIEVYRLVNTEGKTALVGVKPVIKATGIEIRSAVGNIKLESTDVELENTISVKAVVLPTDSTDYIEWTAEKDENGDEIISIDKTKTGNDGAITITGLKAGKTKLTATAKSGVKTSIEVNVIIPTTEIVFKDGDKVIDSKEGVVVYNGISKTVNIEVLPLETTDKVFTWKSDNQNIVVEQSTDGKSAIITAKASTTANISVTTESKRVFNLSVNALIPADGISFTCTKTSINKNGQAVDAICDISPADSNDTITYTVDKEGVVEITPNTYNKKILSIQGKEVGTAVITATTGSGKSASITIDVVTVDMASDDISVSGIANGSQYTYTGSEIRAQDLSIRCISNFNKDLVEGIDYQVEYANNINVTDEAKLTIKGIGDYSGERVITYKITPKNGAYSDVTAVFDETGSSDQLVKVYNGNIVNPTVTVKDPSRAENETVLINGVDYDVEYVDKNSVNAGSYNLNIKFKGNYSDTKILSYRIERKNISDLEDGTKVVSILGVNPEYSYTGSAITPAITVKDLARNVEIKSGYDKDYVVRYENNLDASTGETKAKIIVEGYGNYQGEVECEFIITPADLSKTTVVPIASQIYTGSYILPVVTVKLGNVEVPSVYYTVKYTNNKKTGRATITITGKGNYKGTKTTSFKILPTQVINIKQTSATNTSVKLSWSKNPSGQAVSRYYIYKVDTRRNKYTKIGSTTKNYFTVSKLKAGSNYTYAVAAQKSGYVGAYSQTVTAMTSASKVTIRSIKAAGNGSVNIKWRAVKGATSYKIYTSTNGKKYKLAATTSFTEHALSGLRARRRIYVKIVTIRNINGKDYKSSYSSTKNVVVK